MNRTFSRVLSFAEGGLLAASLQAQFSPPIPVDPPDFSTMQDLKYFDINADSYPDLVVCTTIHDNRIIWYPNDGTGHYLRARKIATVMEPPTDVEFGDVDGDGYPDIVYAMRVSGVIGWCRNNGQAQFTVKPPLLIGLGDILDFSLTDTDGDTDADFVAFISGSYQVLSSTNEASTFSTPVVIMTTTDDALHAIGDINGDGNPDLVITACCPLPVVRWFAGDGAGGWGPAIALPTVGGVYVLSLHDFDLDGDLDVHMWTNQKFYCAFNDGFGGFAQASLLMDRSPGYFYEQRAGDFDGDGDIDMTWRKSESPYLKVQWSQNNGDGTWGPAQTIDQQTSSGFTAFATADADGDGDDELAFALSYPPLLCLWGANSEFTGIDTVSRRARETTDQFIAAEINGDGLMDLLETSRAGDVVWYPGIDGSSWGEAVPIFRYETQAWGIQAGDTDGDGDNDVVTTGWGDNGQQLIIHANDGAGGFSVAQALDQGSTAIAPILLTDVNDDGDLDIFSDGNGVCLNLNTGGTFGPCTGIGGGSTGDVGDMLLADLDQDGYDDFAYTVAGTPGWKYRLGLGNGTFGTTQPGGTWNGSGYTRLRSGDIDGDGDADIAVHMLHLGATTLGWYENLGSNQWSSVHPIATGDNGQAIFSLDLSDVDSDGDLDVLANFDNLGAVGYFINDGSGAFGPMQSFATQGILWEMADVDGDGKEDALVGASDFRRVHKDLFGSVYGLGGGVYHDANSNGIRDTDENGIPLRPLLTSPFGEQPFTNSAGVYTAMATVGANSVTSLFLDASWDRTTDSATYHHTLTPIAPVSIGNDFGYIPLNDTTWVHTSITLSGTRCEFISTCWIDLLNLGSTITSGLLVVEWDPLLTFITSTPPPDSIVGALCYWAVDSLTYFELRGIEASVLMPSANNMDSLITVEATFGTVTPVGGLEFSGSWAEGLTCSYDPNDKRVVPAGEGPQGLIPIDTEWLDYTIRFQNTGTAPAGTVIVKDLISTDLDRTSMQVIGTSHSLTTLGILPNGVAEFRFEGIELPDSASNEPESHGFLRYRIRTGASAGHGTTFLNTASIYFDSNEPVLTNTTTNTLVDCSLWDPSITVPSTDLLEATQGVAYQWYFDGTPLLNDTTSTLFIVLQGDYSVMVTSEYGCSGMSDPFNVITLGTPEFRALRASIVPNPFGSTARMLFSEAISTRHVIDLIDVHGRVLKSIRGNGTKEIALDREDLAPGIYLIRVANNGQLLTTTRFVVE